ncbi:NAC domain-containing protein 26-like [Panicum miliaceum]|uniref:NAC domain-containing protein 26-like n=1 Tax=Panicum miliaceum TaxID=4540 RepID=A0A3L6PJS8_PANMI|nr:NAC domain-containing protein 26-like [Panicum miliaceum]
MEQVRWPDVPPCYRFTPTARDLIRYYLNPWVASPGQTPFGEPEGVVCAADVYSVDLGTLTSRLRRFGHDDGNWYFLCVARWKDGNAGNRMSRAVQGGGTWHGSGKRVAVRRHGYRQTFEYRDAGGGKSAWLMEKFGSSLPEATDGEGVRVICRVHRTPRAAADGDGGEGRQEETDEAQFRSSKRPRGTLSHEGGSSGGSGGAQTPLHPKIPWSPSKLLL